MASTFSKRQKNNRRIEKNSPNPKRSRPTVKIDTSVKEQFVNSVRQTFEDKGLLLGQKTVGAVPIRASVEKNNPDIAQAIDDNPDVGEILNKFDEAATKFQDTLQKATSKSGDLGTVLSRQIAKVDALTSVIEKVTDNIKRMGELSRVQDVKRNTLLIESAKALRAELEQKLKGPQITAAATTRSSPSRATALSQKTSMTVENAVITVAGSAKLLGNEKKRNSGTYEKKKTHHHDHKGVLDGPDEFSGAGALALGMLGAGIWKYILTDEQKEELKKQVAEVFSGATKMIYKSVSDYTAELVKENKAAAAYGIGNIATGATKALTAATKSTASLLNKASATMSKMGLGLPNAITKGSSSVAGKIGTVSKFSSKALPVVGGVIDFSERVKRGEPIGRAAMAGVGGTMGNIVGDVAGTTAGALALNPVTPILGGVAGGIAGSKYGSEGGAKLYDELFNEGKSPNTTIPTLPQLGSSKSTKPDEIRSTVYNYFIDKGLSPEAAAGLTGNFEHETGGFKSFNNPDDKKASGKSVGPAKGLAQWNQGRLSAFRARYHKDPNNATLEEQLDFVWYELNNTEKTSLTELQKAKSAKDAARIVEVLYERPAKSAEGSSMRVKYADRVFQAAQTGKLTRQKDVTNALILPPKSSQRVIPQTSQPLKEIQDAAETQSSPTVIVAPNTTNITASPSSQQTGPMTPVMTLRDMTNSFVRNLDKHTGYHFSR